MYQQSDIISICNFTRRIGIAITTNNLVLRDQLFALATAASEQQPTPLQVQDPERPAKRNRTSGDSRFNPTHVKAPF